MAKKPVKLVETDRRAHVQMGVWDGNDYALDDDYPICQLADGRYVVVLDDVDELPPVCSSLEMSAAKTNGRKAKEG